MMIDKSRLARECAKLDRAFEQSLAEEGLTTDMEEWPEDRETSAELTSSGEGERRRNGKRDNGRKE
jgi:hypothetical protein